MAAWTFVLASATGANLAELADATDRRLTFARNRPAEFRCQLSHDDEAAALLLDELANGLPRVTGWRHETTRVKRYAGVWAPSEEELDPDHGTLSVQTRDRLTLLEGRATAELYDPPGLGITDAGQIMWDLISRANTERATGITQGTIQASTAADVTYEYKNVWEAIRELSEIDLGPDFELTPADVFNVYTEQGQVRAGARFEHGPLTLDNCSHVRRSTRYPRNRVIVIGDEGVAAQRDDTASQAKYGLWTHVESMSDQIDADVLGARAQALLRPRPIEVISFTPDLGLDSCPRPFTDFWVGDTVPFYARRGAFVREAEVRVNQIDLLIDDDGNESFDLTPPDEEDGGDARLIGGLTVEVT